MLKVGDWVTQYYKGYWMVIKIIPRKPNNSNSENKVDSTKNQGGNWILMKKGFTPKMIFRLDSSYCDEGWFHLVTAHEQELIDSFFAEHPSEYQRFIGYEYIDRPAVASIWINVNFEEQKRLQLMLTTLPSLFTKDLFLSELTKYDLQSIITKPPAKHLLTFDHSVWEVDNDNNPLFKNPQLKCFNSQ